MKSEVSYIEYPDTAQFIEMANKTKKSAPKKTTKGKTPRK